MGADIRAHASLQDFRQLKKFSLWGRAASFVGYATSWIVPNPLSALLIGLGNYARWSLVFHQISHGALDRIPGVPARYKSSVFAQGFARFTDYFDWIVPEHWKVEHNQLHHYHLGTDEDPDIVFRNTRVLRSMRVPRSVRYALAFVTAAVWKPLYYAPNTVMESRYQRGLTRSKNITWQTWNPLSPDGRELWLGSLLPYASLKFIVVPLLFAPLGAWAVGAVFLNSLMGELVANLYGFAMIGPNHTGDDVYTFADSAKGRGDFYVRQIVGSVNYPGGTDFLDFVYGGMNYQIEHHVWPTASVFQCRRMRPQLKALCLEYGVPYKESPVFPRLIKTIKTMAGECPSLEAKAYVERAPAEVSIG